jgi:hypothetical protein
MENTIRLYGVDLPIAANVKELCEIIVTRGKGAMLLDIRDYAKIWQKIFEFFHDHFRQEYQYIRGVSSSLLICRSCNLIFPKAFLSELKGIFETSKIPVTGCPQCGGEQVCFAYDNPQAEDISQSDIIYLGDYWHRQAQIWWNRNTIDQAVCDLCGSLVRREMGYLWKDHLMCESCGANKLFGAEALANLQKNPHCFGEWELRKARYFSFYPEKLRLGSSQK